MDKLKKDYKVLYSQRLGYIFRLALMAPFVCALCPTGVVTHASSAHWLWPLPWHWQWLLPSVGFS